jgi:hypothetical protein
MKRNILFGFCTLVFWGTSSAQTSEPCGHSAYIAYLESVQPGIKENIDKTFHQARQISQQKYKAKQDTVHTIQVVFHVVYHPSRTSLNIADQHIISQMGILNACFNRTNADTVNTRNIFKPVAGDAGIQFVLATTDPSGNPTNGIVRKETSITTFGSNGNYLQSIDRVKQSQYGSLAWDTEKYLNIWVCDMSVDGQDAVLGYAYPPTGADNWGGTSSFAIAEMQGVALHYKIVGENNPNLLATGSKTAVHEVGHFLGLRHIWGDGGCGVDDYMDDTPIAGMQNQGCNKGTNSCFRTVQGDLPDMVENYMDYSDGSCQNIFTKQQVAQMRSNLTTFRSGIYTTYTPEPMPVVEPYAITVSNMAALRGLKVMISGVKPAESATYTLKLYSLLGQPLATVSLKNEPSQQVEILQKMPPLAIYYLYENDNIVRQGKVLFGM